MIQGYWKCEKCSTVAQENLTPNCYTICLSCGKSRYPDTPTEQPQKGSNSSLAILPSVDIPKRLKQGKKARSIKWEYKGVVFDSTDEKDRYLYLESLQERGLISNLVAHPQTVVNPAVVIPANAIHGKIKISEEIYTPDFAYRWQGYSFLEDVKAPRFTSKRKTLKARAEPSSKLKYRQLQRLLATYPKRVFLLTVFHSGLWHYFDCEQHEIKFSLEAIKSEAA